MHDADPTAPEPAAAPSVAVARPGPLQGLKVLELGQLIAGPFAGKTLADFGADVIKVEPPAGEHGGGGDPLRQWRMLHHGTSVWWQVQSRNKRSIALDLRQPEGQAVAKKLVAQADVLVENFRPGVMARLGLADADLAARFPSLVRVSITGFGAGGPRGQDKAYDAVIQALGGLACSQRDPATGAPVILASTVSDMLFSDFIFRVIKEVFSKQLDIDKEKLTRQSEFFRQAVYK